MPLRLYKRRNSPNWYIRGTVRRRFVDETTGTDDKAAAEAIRAAREWDLLQGSIFGRAAAASFLEAAVSYLEHGGDPRFVPPLTDRLGTHKLSAIDQRAIDDTALALYPQASAATRNRQVYTPASAILKHAVAQGLCAPITLRRPRQQPCSYRWLTPAELDRLVLAAAPHLARLIVFLAYTGARLSEALRLDARELDRARAQVTFLDTKNGTTRAVPLTGRVLAALKHCADSGPVFCRPTGGAYAARVHAGGQIKTGFRAAVRRAGIAPCTPHDLRHTFATWHYQANHDLAALMRLGGWKSERMVLRYAHANVGELAASMAALPGATPGKTAEKSRKRSAPKPKKHGRPAR